MKYYKKPHFIIKNNAQKGGYYYKDILTDKVLKDITLKVTGETEYTVEFDDEDYNRGRLAILHYKENKNYISLSIDGKVQGRNYFFQSFTTALITYYREGNSGDNIYFYFLDLEGNIETKYYVFMYRLMATAGVKFLNEELYLNEKVVSFSTIDDVIAHKEQLRNKNRANNSTYITRTNQGITEVYAKTYGANKKESVLIALVASILSDNIKLYEICEENLTVLPRPDKKVLKSLGNVSIITSNIQIEREEFEKNNSLRSPKFIYNLLDRLGPKKCVLCDCEIPELIEGAHLWEVKNIKEKNNLSQEEKLRYAIDGNNGLWLCVGHHKMFDQGLIQINVNGSISIKENLKIKDEKYILDVTNNLEIPETFINENVLKYINRRYEDLNQNIQEYRIIKE